MPTTTLNPNKDRSRAIGRAGTVRLSTGTRPPHRHGLRRPNSQNGCWAIQLCVRLPGESWPTRLIRSIGPGRVPEGDALKAAALVRAAIANGRVAGMLSLDNLCRQVRDHLSSKYPA
jgi:hypothetical protein